jgi:hypothetical protein
MAAVTRTSLRVFFVAAVGAALVSCGDIAFLSTLQKVVDGQKWVQVTKSAAWSERRGFSLVEFNGKMWLCGGAVGSTGTYYNDVYSSSDGATWTLVTSSPGWGARAFHVGLAYGGRMWIIGGQGSATFYGDVWSTADGTSWTLETATPLWSARFGHAGVVFANEMWILGGRDGTGVVKEAWHSTDGITWALEPVALPVSGGVFVSADVLSSRIWIVGGQDTNATPNGYKDVVFSGVNDGTSWSTAPAPPWSARATRVTAYRSLLWLVGGGVGGTPGTALNDVWTTGDGSSWTQSDVPVPWAKRRSCGSIAFHDRLWVMGGWDGTTSYNDVWSFGK